MTIEGTIKTWNDDRGFGFIEPLHGGQEIFLHIKACVARSGRPEVGQRVTFEVEMTPDGRKRAKRVEVIRSRRPANRLRNDNPARWGTASYFAIPAFVIVFAVTALLWRVPGWVAGVYFVASVVCFVVYAIVLSFTRSTSPPRLPNVGVSAKPRCCSWDWSVGGLVRPSRNRSCATNPTRPLSAPASG